MSEYYKPFNLSCWEELKSTFVERIERNAPQGRVLFYAEGSPEYDLLTDIAYDDLHAAIGDNVKIHHSMLILQPGNHPGIPHVDGMGEHNSNFPGYSLNIPIFNCEQGEMLWFGGNYEIEMHHAEDEGITSGLNSYAGIKWHGEPVVVERKIIDTPHLVKIDVPHTVINHSTDYRIMLMIRTTPDFQM